MDIDINELKFLEDGLIPAIVQDDITKQVLMLAYMNKEALTKTIETKETWFFSRSRQSLWNKGETSGNKQQVISIAYDCDQDALLVKVRPLGPACHTGEKSCFFNQLYGEEQTSDSILEHLTKTIKNRRENPVEGSYTTYLFKKGLDKILKKVGEETSEVIIGAKNKNHEEMVWEIADLTYHTLVLMELMDVRLDDISQELYKRHLAKLKKS